MDDLPSLRLGTEPEVAPALDPYTHPELFAGVTAKRVFAYLIDAFIIAVLSALGWISFVTLGLLTFGLTNPLMALVLLVIPLAYHTLLIGGPRSATFGMRALAIEVRRLDGGRPDYLLAALQTIVFYLSVGLTSWLILLVALFNARGRTLHDILCGTVVVNTPPLTLIEWQR